MLNKRKRCVLEQAYQVSKALQNISRSDKVNSADVIVRGCDAVYLKTINNQFKTRPLILPLHQYLHSDVNVVKTTSEVGVRRQWRFAHYV